MASSVFNYHLKLFHSLVIIFFFVPLVQPVGSSLVGNGSSLVALQMQLSNHSLAYNHGFTKFLIELRNTTAAAIEH